MLFRLKRQISNYHYYTQAHYNLTDRTAYILFHINLNELQLFMLFSRTQLLTCISYL